MDRYPTPFPSAVSRGSASPDRDSPAAMSLWTRRGDPRQPPAGLPAVFTAPPALRWAGKGEALPTTPPVDPHTPSALTLQRAALSRPAQPSPGRDTLLTYTPHCQAAPGPLFSGRESATLRAPAAEGVRLHGSLTCPSPPPAAPLRAGAVGGAGARLRCEAASSHGAHRLPPRPAGQRGLRNRGRGCQGQPEPCL